MSRPVHCRCFSAVALFLLLIWPAGCAQKGESPASPSSIPTIRVRLLEGQSQVTVASTDSVAFREAPGVNPRPINVPRRTPVPVLRTPSGWRIGDLNVDASELTLLPLGADSHLSINGRPYRGDFRLVPLASGKFDVVNVLDLESYLKGVLAKELLRDWHEEAYRAQAIVARTYAIYEIKMGGSGRYWDVHPDERSQVYGGIGAENGLSRSAADATAGVVVAYGPKGQEKIFKAYFSACCGGISQSSADAFGEKPFPPLSDQNVGARCNASLRFNWGPVVIEKKELTRRFRKWGAARDRAEKDMGEVEQIAIAFTNKWGRPVRFNVTDEKGKRYSLSGTELRYAINMSGTPDTTIYSSFCTPSDAPTAVRFVDGHGNGHGVGLCQYCAQAQAESGVAHEDIVIGAFPGASLQRGY